MGRGKVTVATFVRLSAWSNLMVPADVDMVMLQVKRYI